MKKKSYGWMNYLVIWRFTGGFVFKWRNWHSSTLLRHSSTLVFAILFGENDSRVGDCVFLFFFFKFTKRARVLELQNAYAFWCSITRARYCYLAYMSADMSGSDLQFQALWKRSAFFFLCNMSVFLKSEVASKRSLNFLHTPS